MGIVLDENEIWKEYRKIQAQKLKSFLMQEIINAYCSRCIAKNKEEYERRSKASKQSYRNKISKQYRNTREYQDLLQERLDNSDYQDILQGKKDDSIRKDFGAFWQKKYDEERERQISCLGKEALDRIDTAKIIQTVFDQVKQKLDKILITEEFEVYPEDWYDSYHSYNSYGYPSYNEEDEETIEDLLEDSNAEIFTRIDGYDSLDNREVCGVPLCESCLDLIRATLIDDKIFEGVCDLTQEDDWDLFKDRNDHAFWELTDECESEIYDKLVNYYDRPRMLKLLSQNPNYKEIFEELIRKKEFAQKLYTDILATIPDNIADLYPNARMMTRKFIIHAGPTNSGKTHEAMKSFTTDNTGVYLAPLRLLAYEQFDRLNKDGIITNLVTGEEIQNLPGANHTASTIEMLDEFATYDVAVIDECQMMSDNDRGGAWTKALLGVCAKEIHVCAAPYAIELIKSIIGLCGDEVVVVNHERQTKLSYDDSKIKIPDSLEKGDALIVFSRQSVLRLAAELQKENKKCSIIYGSLPYDVRHEEARKFASGETDLLVATDAIGMGLNLPIRRIIFIEHSKFDGTKSRTLTTEEIRQISGRAGRYGIYDEGFYAAYEGKYVKHLYNLEVPNSVHAKVSFPLSLMRLNGKLSELLKQWDNIPLPEIFEKESIKTMQKLADILESEYPQMDKYEMLKFCSLPFDVDKENLMTLWLNCVEMEQDEDVTFKSRKVNKIKDAQDLENAEIRYKELDLIYQFCRTFRHIDWYEQILKEKHELSDQIVKYLATSPLKPRKCKHCGKSLPWYHRFPMCESCHSSLYSRPRYNRWYDDDDWGY